MIDRGQLTRKERAEVNLRQNGLCAICKQKLMGGDTEYDHTLALIDGGTNELSNWRAVHSVCHAKKSAAEHKANSKAKRIKYGKARKGRPMPGTKASGIRKRVNGTVWFSND